MAMVWVRPGMLPATISVAPKSPTARAKAIMPPATNPRHARGRVMLVNTPHSERPSRRAASSRRGSTLSMAARAGLMNSGSEVTRAASTAPRQVNTSVRPRLSSSKRPSQAPRPNTTSR